MVHRIHYERNKYIYDLYYVKEQISTKLYEWLIDEKIADEALIAKWKKVCVFALMYRVSEYLSRFVMDLVNIDLGKS